MDGLETILSVWDFAYFQVYMFVYYMSVSGIQNLKLVQMILSFFGGKLGLCFRGAVLVRFQGREFTIWTTGEGRFPSEKLRVCLKKVSTWYPRTRTTEKSAWSSWIVPLLCLKKASSWEVLAQLQPKGNQGNASQMFSSDMSMFWRSPHWM